MDISLGGLLHTIADFEKLDERSIRLKVVTKDLQWNDIILGDVNGHWHTLSLVYNDEGKRNT
jgi:hypothetical protein